MRGGGVPPNDYNWLHRGGGVWKKPKIDYIIYEQPLIEIEIKTLKCQSLKRDRDHDFKDANPFIETEIETKKIERDYCDQDLKSWRTDY